MQWGWQGQAVPSHPSTNPDVDWVPCDRYPMALRVLETDTPHIMEERGLQAVNSHITQLEKPSCLCQVHA